MKMELMKEPFKWLRPCLTFKDMGYGSEFIPIYVILSQLKFKLADNMKKRENSEK